MTILLDSRRRAVAGALLAALLGTALTPLLADSASATGAAPAVALVAPAAGAASVAAPTTLQVRPTDPDDGTLAVEFHAQARAAGTPNPNAPFSLLVIPDTQNYTSSSANAGIFTQQTQWIAANRSALNLAFVTHLGDLVGVETSAQQWQRASASMAVLDGAGIPNTVLPGNHDLNLTTGSAALYQQYFPPSRYSGASWNSPTASYGGYLGQNQFGPDPVDRGNMDNYALFSAGGMDFLLLNLEFNAPDYALDWAKRVLAAYPDRRAILATHSYVSYGGDISGQMDRADGGNSPQQMYTKLVQPSCSIFLVVNGHFHNGDLSEARRTDTNACGGRVDSILSDYQDRANGGNGFLRYYTFVPASNEIRAYTYSPSLGVAETDADSQFTIPYDMSAPPSFPLVGTASVASGSLASATGPTVPAGTTVDWYTTVSDGTTTTRSPVWSYTTAAAGGSTVLASDTFTRNVTGGWGSASVGGPWTLAGGNTRFGVDGTGTHVIEAGRTVSSALGAVASTAVDLQTTMSLDRLSGDVYATVSGRLIGAADYGARIKVLSTGVVQLHLERSNTMLVGGTVAGLTLGAAQKVRLRLQVDGTSPTTLRAKLWRDGDAEPAAWTSTTTDATAGLQSAGGIRLQSYVSSGLTGPPMTVRWDDLVATAIGSAPANQPPVASFTASASGLAVSVDATGSSDPDGTIASRTWTFGDGGTASGATVSHVYPTSGSYPITLTVTDNAGATATRTSTVTVTAPPPVNQPPVAAFTSTATALSVAFDSSTSSDPDGTIVDRGWDFGDGGAGTGTTPTHVYAAAGTYQVALTVTDDRGASDDRFASVTVTAAPPPNQPPVASFGSSVAGLDVTVDSSGSSDPDGTIASRTWTFGDGGTATGTTAAHHYATSGTYSIVLTVTDDQGATATSSSAVTVTAPTGPTVLAADTFGRTASTGWGAAETGGAWTIGTPASRWAVASGTGVMQVPSGVTMGSSLTGVNSTATDVSVVLSLDAIPNSTVYSTVSGRIVGSADYGAQVKVYSNGSTQLYLERSGTALVGGVIAGLVTSPGTRLAVRVQVQGTAPTTVRAKVWVAGTAEPAAWQYTTTDATAALQAAGGLRLQSYLSSAATNGPVTVRWDDLRATAIG